MAGDRGWEQLYGLRSKIVGRVVRDVSAALAARPPRPRAAATDDPVFAPLAEATVIAVGQRDYGLAVELFHECLAKACEYEAANQCELHKGAMAFNVAVALLRANDFPAAMHYFELAEPEDHLTTGDQNLSVYRSGLFQRNFWVVLDRHEGQAPLALYKDFWGVPFGSAEAQRD